MSRGTVIPTVAVLLLLAVSARAGEAAGDPYKERAKLLRDARRGVVLLRTGLGVASGTVLDAEAGLVACAKGPLNSAGKVRAYAFVTEVPERGPDNVKRVDLGEAQVVAIHRSADAAILAVKLPPEMKAFGFQAGAVNQGAPVTVAGVQGAAPFDDIGDLNIRRGAVGAREKWEPDRVPLTAPTHRNSAGGAVLLSNGALFGIASFDLPDGVVGAAVPHQRFLELRDNPGGHAMPEAEAAEYVRRKPGPPPFWPVSPGGPEGKRVDFGQGVVALKESRAVLATGVFVLDRDEPLEYLATPIKRGKLHETVVAVDADPAVLNLAFMALRHRSGGWIERGADRPAKPHGARLGVHVEWDSAEALAIREWVDAAEARRSQLYREISEKKGKLSPELWGLRNVDRKLTREEERLIKEIEELERQVAGVPQTGFREVREKAREGVIKWGPGPTVRVRAEELMFNVKEGHPMVRTDWIYTGSGFFKDEETGRRLFRATLDGVLVAVYRDPAAMFTIPFDAPDDHSYYSTRGCFNPPRGTRCTVIFLPGEEASEDGGTQP